MRVLITGGAGFIGSNLARELTASRHISHIRIVDDLSTGNEQNLRDLDVDFQKSTILDETGLREAAKNCDSIVHLAAIPSVPRSIANPRATHDANTTGTLNVLEAARHNDVRQVIVASSSSVYGSNPRLPKTEFDWTRPMSPYAVSKQATEGYALAYGHSYGLHTLAFRFFNVYGPNQAPGHAYAAVIPKFLDKALRDEPVTIHGDGTQTRDFTYVDTVTSVIRSAITRQVHSPHPVNLAYGTKTSLLSLLELMEETLGRPISRRFSEPRIGDVRESQASGDRIADLFPDISPVDLRKGIETTIGWFRR